MCEGCRFGSHKLHQHDFVAHVAASERTRMKDSEQKALELSSALQGQIDALNASSKKCSDSAAGIKQEISRQFDRARAALLKQRQELTLALDQLSQVSRLRVGKCGRLFTSEFNPDLVCKTWNQ